MWHGCNLNHNNNLSSLCLRVVECCFFCALLARHHAARKQNWKCWIENSTLIDWWVWARQPRRVDSHRSWFYFKIVEEDCDKRINWTTENNHGSFTSRDMRFWESWRGKKGFFWHGKKRSITKFYDGKSQEIANTLSCNLISNLFKDRHDSNSKTLIIFRKILWWDWEVFLQHCESKKGEWL